VLIEAGGRETGVSCTEQTCICSVQHSNINKQTKDQTYTERKEHNVLLFKYNF
jgi:hypothetical protein